MRRPAAITIAVAIILLTAVPAVGSDSSSAEQISMYGSPDGDYGYVTHGSGSDDNPYWSEIRSFSSDKETVFLQSALEGYVLRHIESLEGCGSSTVVVPQTVTSIAGGAFDGCKNLTSLIFLGNGMDLSVPEGTDVTVLGGTDGWPSEYNVLELKGMPTFSYFVLGGEAYVFSCNGKELNVPDSDPDGIPFVSVCAEICHENKTIRSVSLGTNVREIGVRAFYNAENLETAVFGGGVKDVRDEAFRYCVSLQNVGLGGVETIGFEAFRDCRSFTEVSVPDTVKDAAGGCFYLCRDVTKVSLPAGITELSERMFGYCDDLTEINLLNIRSVGHDALRNCISAVSFAFSDKLQEVGDDAFAYCESLTDIELGNSLASVGDNAFSDCKSLITLKFPATLKSIGNHALNHCNSLTDLYFEGDMPQIEGNLLRESQRDTVAIHIDEDHAASWSSFEEVDIGGDDSEDGGDFLWFVAIIVIAAVIAGILLFRLFLRRRPDRS